MLCVFVVDHRGGMWWWQVAVVADDILKKKTLMFQASIITQILASILYTQRKVADHFRGNHLMHPPLVPPPVATF